MPKIYFHVLFKHNCYILIAAAPLFIVLSLLRLGFGSFVDKVVMPYVSTVPRKLKEPCDGCAAPYGFKHHMRLSTDTSGISLKPSKDLCEASLKWRTQSVEWLARSIATIKKAYYYFIGYPIVVSSN